MIRVEVEIEHPGARVHEFGAVITPKTRTLLRFVPRGGSEPVFAKQVHIPARPYFRPAFDLNRGRIEAAIRRRAEQELRKFIS